MLRERGSPALREIPRPPLADELLELLGDRVPSHILDRMLVELLRHHLPEDADLRELLETGTPSALTRADGRDHCLTGVRTTEVAETVSRLSLHASAYRLSLTHCRRGPTVWILVSQQHGPWLNEALLNPHMPRCLALQKELPDLRLVPSVRANLDELLDLGVRRGWSGVADPAGLSTARKLEALLDLAARQAALLEGPLDVLLDSPQHRPLAETLATWMLSNQDAAATAAGQHLHVNTVRYRLRRAQELTGVDFSDQDQRLLAEVQLRIWRMSGRAQGC